MAVRLGFPLSLITLFFLLGHAEDHKHAPEAAHPVAHPSTHESAPEPLIVASPKAIAKPISKNDFVNAANWSDGKAELLIYSVQKSYRGNNLSFSAQCVTEKQFLNKKDGTLSRKSSEGLQKVFSSTIHFQFNTESLLRNYAIAIQMNAENPMQLLRQETSIQSWLGLVYRILEVKENKTKLFVFSSGQESSREIYLDKSKLLSEEMLFTYLRSIPLEAGYSEEIWLLDNAYSDKVSTNIQYAKIRVIAKTNAVHEILTWLVEVQKADGKKLSFWIGAEGLHAVVRAALSDKSVWNLETIQRKKYWSW